MCVCVCVCVCACVKLQFDSWLPNTVARTLSRGTTVSHVVADARMWRGRVARKVVISATSASLTAPTTTFLTPSVMSKRTIRIRDDGDWQPVA